MNPSVQAILKEGRKILREAHGCKTKGATYCYLIGRASQCVRACDIIGPDPDEQVDVDILRTKCLEAISRDLKEVQK